MVYQLLELITQRLTLAHGDDLILSYLDDSIQSSNSIEAWMLKQKVVEINCGFLYNLILHVFSGDDGFISVKILFQ